MAQKLTLQELERFLLKAANILRKPSEYKDYIMALLFYKRFSDVYVEEYEKNLQKYKNEKIAKEKFHRFIIPEGCLWEDLRKESKNVGEKLNKILAKITKVNPELEGLLNRIDFNDKDRLSEQKLIQLLEHFSKTKLGNDNVSADVLGDAYQYLIKQFALQAGQKGGEFATPSEVVKVLVNLLEPKEGYEVYDPACGTGGMLIQAYYYLRDKSGNTKKLFLYGQESDLATWIIAKINIILHNMEADIKLGDTFTDPKFLQRGRIKPFDIVLANPPWNQKEYKKFMENDEFNRFSFGIPPNNSADWGWIQHMLSSLNGKGKLGIVLDNGSLFRGSGEDNKQKAEYNIRKKAVDNDLIEAVIALPEKLFYNTGSPGCLIIFNKNKSSKKRGKILFIYAADEFEKLKNMNQLREQDIQKIAKSFKNFTDIEKYAKIISLKDIKENDYDLTVTWYVDAFEEEEQVDVKAVLKDLSQLENEESKIENKLKAYLKELKYG